MKKLFMGILGFAFASCLATGASLYNANVDASAAAGADVFTETKCQISNDGERMLLVTGIKDVSLIYELGYEINGEEYEVKTGDTAETDVYYESLTLGSVTKTASEFITGAQGLLVWEIDYDSTIAYSAKAYAYIGELNDNNQLIAPNENPRTYAQAKTNFNVFEITFEYEDGTVISTENVNYGGKVTEIEAPAKDNAVFDGWYYNGVEFDFTNTKITAPITITAKYKTAVNYTVEVLAAKYNRNGGTAGHYGVDTASLTYVDVTSDYAKFFGLDENNQAKAFAGSVVDLASKVDSLQGAKANAESVLSATVKDNGSTKLTVKLDFDEKELGFKLADMDLYEYNWDNVTFELTYMDGICGVLINTSNVGNGKTLLIDVEDITVADYAALYFNYKEKSGAGSTRISLFDGEAVESTQKQIVTASAGNFVNGTAHLNSLFPAITTITKIRLQFFTTSEKDLFIGGIQKTGFVKESVTYSMENNNLLDITRTLGVGEISDEAQSHYFANASQQTELTANALYYSYEGADVSGAHKSGIIFDLKGIRLSDYESIKIVFAKTSTVSNSTGDTAMVVYCDGIEISSTYSNLACWTVDVVVDGAGKVTNFSTIEISNVGWASVSACEIWVAYIELVAKA